MLINNQYHLSYCTNIHPTETWSDTFDYLKNYTTDIKQAVAPEQSFGIGLRLSNRASIELQEQNQLQIFKEWLAANNCYVFTMNAFPYGEFHRQRVKDFVHYPDWRTSNRRNYTTRLIDQLSELLPEGMEGGLSTSPLSYKPWLKSPEDTEKAFQKATKHILGTISYLDHIYEQTGKLIHLDIEPEPDGLIENSVETIDYFQNRLLPAAQEWFKDRHSPSEIEAIVYRHFQLCYDVCHFAIAYESPKEAVRKLRSAGIQIGKIQISAALKAILGEDRTAEEQAFGHFVESTYLHQVIARKKDGTFQQFRDLPEALIYIKNPNLCEYRAHFHVPLFVEAYGALKSTQDEIVNTLNLLKEAPFTKHLEVETYTWEVLPEALRLPLKESIIRELAWVKAHL